MSGTLSPTCDSISPSLEVERVVDWMDGWVEAPFAAPSDFDAAAPFERKLRRRRTPNGSSLNQQVERPTEGGRGGGRVKAEGGFAPPSYPPWARAKVWIGM